MNFTADEFLRHTKLPCLDEAGSCRKVIDDMSFRNRRDVLPMGEYILQVANLNRDVL